MNFFALKNVIGFLIVITLISGLVVGVRLVQQQTQLKSKAAEILPPAPTEPFPCNRPTQLTVGDIAGRCNQPADSNGCYKTAHATYLYTTDQDGDGVADAQNPGDQPWCDSSRCSDAYNQCPAVSAPPSTGNVGVAPTPTSCNSISLSKSQATPGELINVTLNSSSSSYNTIYALPSTSLLASQIGTGTFLVTAPPTPGTYQIVANTYTNDCSYFCDYTGHWKRNTSLNAGGGCPATTWENIGECTNNCQTTLTVVTPPPVPAPGTTTPTTPAGGTGPTCTVDLKANGSSGPVTVDNNATVTLSWTSQNADRVNATGAWSGSKSTSGSEVTSRLSDPGNLTYSLTCIKNNSSQTSTDSVQVTVRGAGGAPITTQDFSISASAPNPASVTAGASVSSTSTVTITSLNSFNSAVVLSATSPRTDITASVSPTPVTPAANGTATSTLTITTAATTPAGTYTITVTGTSGTLTHSSAAPLTVLTAASAARNSSCSYKILDNTNGRDVTSSPLFENNRYTFQVTMTNTGDTVWERNAHKLQALDNTVQDWRLVQRDYALTKEGVKKSEQVAFNIVAQAQTLPFGSNFEDRSFGFSMADANGAFGQSCSSQTVRVQKGLASTLCYVISENLNEVNNVFSCDDPLAKLYTNNPTVINYTFRNQSPGQKFIFVKFIDVNGRPSDIFRKIVTYSPNPAISNVDCAYDSGSGLTTTYNIVGSGFGLRNVNSKLRVGNQNATILTWGSAEIIAQVNQRIEGNTPVQVTLEDGRSADGSCTVGTTTATLSVKNQCLSGQFDIDNVDVNIFSSVPEPFFRQKIKADKDGNAQGFAPKLERNKNYSMIIKAPSTLAKGVVFRTTSGTSVVGPIVLPCGNIAPLPVPDNIVNSFDVSALFSQWSLVKDVSRPADLNKDGRVNSVDYAFMKLNFNKQDEVFTAPVVVLPTPSPTPTPSPSPSPSPSSSPSPSPSPSPETYLFHLEGGHA